MTQFFSSPFVVLDTETTGLYNHDQLLELGAVCIDEWGQIRSKFSTLIKPSRPVDPTCKALRVNQISLTDLDKAPSWETVQVYFDSWLRQIPAKDGEVVCTAFNSSFDKRMLENHNFSLNWGLCVRTATNRCMKKINQQPKNKNGNNRAPSLQEACAFFQIPYPKNAHRALADAEVTAKVAIQAYLRLSSEFA